MQWLRDWWQLRCDRKRMKRYPQFVVSGETIVSMCNYRDELIAVTSRGRVLRLMSDYPLGSGFTVEFIQRIPLE